MYEAKPPGPKRRAFFIAAFSLGLLFYAAAGYLRMTHHPAPKWTQDLPPAFMSAVFALYILLCPMPGMTRTMAKCMVALFALFCAIDLFFFVKG